MTSIVWALHNKMPGEIWEIDEIQKVADQIHAYGFDMEDVYKRQPPHPSGPIFREVPLLPRC